MKQQGFRSCHTAAYDENGVRHRLMGRAIREEGAGEENGTFQTDLENGR